MNDRIIWKSSSRRVKSRPVRKLRLEPLECRALLNSSNEPPVAVATVVGEELREVEGALAVIMYRDVLLSGEGSWDSDGEIVSYHWDFGDNTTSDLKNPEWHTFMADVTYEISLTVTDDSGARGEARLTVGPD